MAHYVVCPQKKIIYRIFKISGALIVKGTDKKGYNFLPFLNHIGKLDPNWVLRQNWGLKSYFPAIRTWG
jgi:hypothetical protein